MRVKNLRYNKGKTDSVGLDFEFTQIEDEDVIDLPSTIAAINPVY